LGSRVPHGGVHRAQDAPRVPTGVRRQIIELARTGRSPEDLARQFEPSAQTIRSWITQAHIDTGEREGLTSQEKAELAALRRRVRQLEEEREIPQLATVFFIKETSR
jgi:transposase